MCIQIAKTAAEFIGTNRSTGYTLSDANCAWQDEVRWRDLP